MFHLFRLLDIISATLTVVLLTTGCCCCQRHAHFRIFPREEVFLGEPSFFLVPTTAPSPQKKPKPPKKIPEERPSKKEVEKDPFERTLPNKILSRMPYKSGDYGLVVPYIDLCLDAEKECNDTFDWGLITPWLFKDNEN